MRPNQLGGLPRRRPNHRTYEQMRAYGFPATEGKRGDLRWSVDRRSGLPARATRRPGAISGRAVGSGERVVVVTGAGHGIGQALVRALAGEGFRLVLGDCDEAALEATAAPWAAASCGQGKDQEPLIRRCRRCRSSKGRVRPVTGRARQSRRPPRGGRRGHGVS
ncbi:SDR family NAD(P)-dependent oxidoreductase [Streptomyces sp. NPDC005180]|uniref:SDR family NAD(P)-dependent oxidoreductase n=1 Tax=Streptomyces sp. NPDC005180 TaxID=3156868 RepID=UPI0033BEE7F7